MKNCTKQANRLSVKKKSLKTMADSPSDFDCWAFGPPNPETNRRNLRPVDDTYCWDKNSHGSPFYSLIVHSKAPYRFLRMLLETLFSNFSDIRACRLGFHQGRPDELLVASELQRWHWRSFLWVEVASLCDWDPPKTQKDVPCPWWVGWIYLVSQGAKWLNMVSWPSMF